MLGIPFHDFCCSLFVLFFSDDSFTPANVLEMTKDVKDWEVLGVLLGIRDPDSKFDKIKQLQKDPVNQKEAMIKLWHSTHPLASWSLLHQALNMKGEMKAAKAIQEKFLKGVKLVACCNNLAH